MSQRRKEDIQEWQHRMQRSAVFDAPTGVAHCMFCPSHHLRLSRLRLPDIAKILIFQFPVRCGRCGQRQYTSPLIAALAGAHQVMRSPRRRKDDVSWAAWTEVAEEEAPGTRPMTTVVGPRSRNLGRDLPKRVEPKQQQKKSDDQIW